MGKIFAETFTTKLSHYVKRGCCTIRDRCLTFQQVLREEGYTKELPLEDAIRLFKQNIGVMDDQSIEAYFGTQPHTKRRRFRSISRYSTGTISQKNIELTQEVKRKEGYFEALRIATIKKRGEVWFFCLNDECLVPQIERHHNEKEACPPIVNFSLSSIRQEEECETTVNNKDNSDNTHTTYRVRERNRSSESIQLTPLKRLVLKGSEEGTTS